MYVHPKLLIYPAPHVSLSVNINLFSVSVSLLLFCINKYINFIIFKSDSTWVISYDICLSLSDWFHSVWQSLGSSLLLQMLLFNSFLWVNNIPLYICNNLNPFVCGWTFSLLSCLGSCKQRCNDNWGACIFRIMVFSGYVPRRGLVNHMVALFFVF